MAKIKLNHRERIEACLAGTALDRVPVALWRHFPVDDQQAETLAKATIQYQQIYDFDFIKVTPASSFCIKDWGAEDEWNGSSEGTRDYTKKVIQCADDWYKLDVLNPNVGFLGEQLRCLNLIVKEVGDQVPVIQTIFNPLSQAKNLVSRDKLSVHVRKHPEAVLNGLRTISQSTIDFILETKKTGISGVFYAVQHAQYGLLTEGEFQTFGKNFDLKILETVQDLWLNVLHLHGDNVMFKMVADYPISVLNWHDQDTYPSLKVGKELFTGVVCGGIQRERTLVLANSAQVSIECKNAIEETGGRRFILGTGCVVPITAPHGNILTVRNSVE